MPLSRSSDYAPLSPSDMSQDTEQEENLSFLQGTASTIGRAKQRHLTIIAWATTLNLLLFVSSLTFLLLVRRTSGLNPLLKGTCFYFPVLDRVELHTSLKQTKGTFFPPPNPTVARQKPNPEADAVWREYELLRPIVLSAEEIRKLGKDPEIAAKFEDKYWNLGDDAYIGEIDVFHQLHCLNSLRKLVYPEYYNHTLKSPGPFHFTHYDHCVDILYQNIICTSSVDIVTTKWVGMQPFPYPDFSINHQCRDFDALVQWSKDNSVDMKKWNAMKKPEGVTEQPAPQEYYDQIAKEGGGMLLLS